jgi:two-component system OmpR family response regulator
MRILLVEDDAGIARLVERGLRAEGHQVLIAARGDDGMDLASVEQFDLVILDIMLPGLDGHAVLDGIRRLRPTPPVLMLTARDAVSDKVRALDAGADDYLTKPFALEELSARVRALGRRANEPRASVMEAGDLRLDLVRRAAWRGERRIELSAREFALLAYLMRHPDQVLTRSQVLDAVWEYDFDPGSNVVDVYIRYLRRKIDEPGKPSLIATHRGAGYRFEPPATAAADGARGA